MVSRAHYVRAVKVVLRVSMTMSMSLFLLNKEEAVKKKKYADHGSRCGVRRGEIQVVPPRQALYRAGRSLHGFLSSGFLHLMSLLCKTRRVLRHTREDGFFCF